MPRIEDSTADGRSVVGSCSLLVSVVIASYNRPESLMRACDSLLNQDFDNYELIVVDQSEEPQGGIEHYMSRFPAIRYYRLDKPNRCRAKNYGVRLSKGDIVLICDDDIIAPPDLVSKHVRHYHDKQVGGVSCRTVEDGQPPLPLKRILRVTFYGRIIHKAYSVVSQNVGTLNGPNMSIRKSLFLNVGMFEERLVGTGIMEEADISYRIRKQGCKIFFDATTTVHHYPQHNGNLAMMAQNRVDWFFSYFYNLAFCLKKNRQYFSLLSAGPFCLALSLKQAFVHRLYLEGAYRMFRGYLKGAVARP